MKHDLIKRILSSLILLPIALFLIIKGSILFNIFLTITLAITLYEWHKMSKLKPYYFFGLIFISISFYTIYKFINFENNYIYFLIVTLICVSTDIGGYIFGNIFKGPKITKISPKKTYSGMIGGYIVSIIVLIVFLSPITITFNILIFILLVSSVSQLGDLIISYFKRLSKIKDTGHIIPGHGGLLDRIDGMIFAFPFSYLILKLKILQIL
jgi:phosphatidate cytidylyltransferase